MIENTNETVLAIRTVNQMKNWQENIPAIDVRMLKVLFTRPLSQPTGEATPFTTASHLTGNGVSAIVRFSNSSPNPETADALSCCERDVCPISIA